MRTILCLLCRILLYRRFAGARLIAFFTLRLWRSLFGCGRLLWLAALGESKSLCPGKSKRPGLLPAIARLACYRTFVSGLQRSFDSIRNLCGVTNTVASKSDLEEMESNGHVQ